jgi:N-acetylated-alpha-linked acidic dipeptidase
VSGVVTVLETARAFGELARRGARPARSIIFATWDAEEWGLIGSTEWVEELEDSLQARVVLYINEDDVTTGPHFAAAASPSLKPFIRDLARAVPDPEGGGSVYDGWQIQVSGDTSVLQFDDLGGGSDFAGFTHHLGIASLSVGFEGLGGIYHSMYDTEDWMTRFGDPGYREHRAVAQLVSLATARFANATILPFDYAAFATELTALETRVDSGLAERHWHASTAELKAALARFGATARAFAATRDSALARGVPAPRAARVNHWLMQVERRFTRSQGLAGRPWYRSLEFASDVDNGYSTMVFPSVNEAIRYGTAGSVERELADLTAHVDGARDALAQAAAALR